MSAMEPLCHLIGINFKKLSLEEYILLEAELFVRILEEIREFFREKYKSYFRLMKFNLKKENTMFEDNFVRLITNDILSTEEYDLNGIACYSNTPEDVVQEIIDGRNVRPSATFLWRIIELHRIARRDLYDVIIKKIINRHLVA
jgi:CTP:phosphocholine cytidylyltransferase-like protein